MVKLVHREQTFGESLTQFPLKSPPSGVGEVFIIARNGLYR